MPSDAERTGDFTDVYGATTAKLKDPISQLAYTVNGVVNKIPASVLTNNAPAVYLLPYMPHTNGIVGGKIVANETPILKQQLGQGDIRVDQQLTSKDHLIGRYSISNNQETDPNAYPAMGSFPLKSRGQDALVRETHVFIPKWINEAQLSYYRSFFSLPARYRAPTLIL